MKRRTDSAVGRGPVLTENSTQSTHATRRFDPAQRGRHVGDLRLGGGTLTILLPSRPCGEGRLKDQFSLSRLPLGQPAPRRAVAALCGSTLRLSSKGRALDS